MKAQDKNNVEIIAIHQEDGCASTAISETIKAANGLGKPIKLQFKGYSIKVNPNSLIEDLTRIMVLEEIIKEMEK